MKKSYFQLDTQNGASKEFTKHAYKLINADNSALTLIHYMGNEKVAIDFPNRNTKHGNERVYIRTCTSV